MRDIIWISVFVFLTGSQVLTGQNNIIFTKSFTKKLERADLEFYHPVERWLKPAHQPKDAYIKHDMTLHSPPDTEVRIKIWNSKNKRKYHHPNVLVMTTLSTIATNDDDALIRMHPISTLEAAERFGATQAIAADFIPKAGYSNYPKGQMLCIYNEETEVLVSYIILFEDELDPFFETPIRFKSAGAYNY